MTVRYLGSLLLFLALLDRGTNKQVVSREKKSEGVRLAEQVKLKFPASNSLTGTDRRYFEMIRSEGGWDNTTAYQSQPDEMEDDREDDRENDRDDERENVSKTRLDPQGFPESFSLTETDREYFNIIKTEDGLSQFYKSVRDPGPQSEGGREEGPENRGQNHHPNFKYHVVTSSNKRIVGLYLPHQ